MKWADLVRLCMDGMLHVEICFYRSAMDFFKAVKDESASSSKIDIEISSDNFVTFHFVE